MLDSEQVYRNAARIVLISPAQRVLLFEARNNQGDHFWVMPGGGLESGETFAEAAQRELWEETGHTLEMGPCIWTRCHTYMWDGIRCNQREHFFVAQSSDETINGTNADAYILSHRWWSMEEIACSTVLFAPRRLPTLLPPILAGEYPEAAIDAGV
jgi:8-oxo-dGTP pyrophosphatase MutT (NUDIX family)